MTSSEPSYHLESADRHTIVTLASALSKQQWSDIEAVGNQLVERLGESKEIALVVDLTNMEYIGSSTVALIVRLWKAVKKNEGQLAVVNTHPVVLEVLQIAGLNKVWTIVNCREDALSALGVGKPSGSGGWLVVVGLVVTAVAAAGLVIQWRPEFGVQREVMLGLLFGGAGLGLLLGLVNTLRQAGLRRVVSLLSLLACLAVGIVGGLKLAGKLDGGASGEVQKQDESGSSAQQQETEE